jgi:hypothetical protein
MTNYVAVLQANYAGTEWSISDNDYDTLQWFSDTPKPTQAELDAAWTDVQQQIADEAEAKQVAREALLTKLGITEQEAQLLLGS